MCVHRWPISYHCNGHAVRQNLNFDSKILRKSPGTHARSGVTFLLICSEAYVKLFDPAELNFAFANSSCEIVCGSLVCGLCVCCVRKWQLEYSNDLFVLEIQMFFNWMTHCSLAVLIDYSRSVISIQCIYRVRAVIL